LIASSAAREVSQTTHNQCVKSRGARRRRRESSPISPDDPTEAQPGTLALAGTGVATASAGTSQHFTPGQLQHHIRSLEAKGYVQTSCTVGGARMFNPRTRRYVTVSW